MVNSPVVNPDPPATPIIIEYGLLTAFKYTCFSPGIGVEFDGDASHDTQDEMFGGIVLSPAPFEYAYSAMSSEEFVEFK